MTTITPVRAANDDYTNPGIVPPWLQHPMPVPPDEADGAFLRIAEMELEDRQSERGSATAADVIAYAVIAALFALALLGAISVAQHFADRLCG